MALRSRNSLALVKLEVTEGVDPVPTPGSDAVQCTRLEYTADPNIIEANEFGGDLGAGIPVVGGVRARATLGLNLRGSGTAITPPRIGPLFKVSGFIETIFATAQPAAPTTVTSGTANSVTFPTGTWPGTTGSMIGHPILVGGNPVAGAITTVRSYTVTGGNVTMVFADSGAPAPAGIGASGGVFSVATTVQRPAGVLYTPGSPAPFPSCTHYQYRDGVLWKITGARGDMALTLNTRGQGDLQFSLFGNPLPKTDVAVPAATFDDTVPPIWANGRFTIDGKMASGTILSLSTNNSGRYQENPNQPQGDDPYSTTGRNMQGNCRPCVTLVANMDLFALLTAGTKSFINARIGSVAGNRWSISVPNALWRNASPVDENGLLVEDAPFSATGFVNECSLFQF